MNCDACQKMMLDYLSEDIQNIEDKEFINHIEHCSDCQAEFKSHRQCWNLLGDVETIDPAPNYISRFWTALSEQETWHERLVRYLSSFAHAKVLVPVFSVLVLAVLVNWFMSVYSPQNAVDDQWAFSMNGFEIEMAESMEIVEHFDIIQNFDILLDFEIIEELDGLEV
ncbi:MAG: zf-HC2 domain-containing protein [Candidatus Omnitrophica bacterium]|nr:zf-HC2 domain-containing protein [Candidatus Omnitrophota bacterium]